MQNIILDMQCFNKLIICKKSLLYNFILNSVSQLTTGILQFIAVITFQMSFTDTAIGNLIYTLFQSIISLF